MILKVSMWRTGYHSYEHFQKIKGTFLGSHILSKLYHSNSRLSVNTVVRIWLWLQEEPILEGENKGA